MVNLVEEKAKLKKALVIKLDERTHREIKLRAFERGITIKEYVMALVADDMAKDKQA
jgi:predicted HicB family RNase H-like nuclease